MRAGHKASCVFVLVTFLSGSQLRADETLDQIKASESSYEEGRYTQALTHLDSARDQIQQKLVAGLKALLPEPLTGWKAEEATGQYGGTPFHPNVISAYRRYHAEQSEQPQDASTGVDGAGEKGARPSHATRPTRRGAGVVSAFDGWDKELEVEFATDSPMLQWYGYFYNPPENIGRQEFLSQHLNTTLFKIHGYDSVQKYMPEDNQAELNIIVGEKLLVTLKGHGLTVLKDLRAYADAIPYEVLAKDFGH